MLFYIVIYMTFYANLHLCLSLTDVMGLLITALISQFYSEVFFFSLSPRTVYLVVSSKLCHLSLVSYDDWINWISNDFVYQIIITGLGFKLSRFFKLLHSRATSFS